MWSWWIFVIELDWADKKSQISYKAKEFGIEVVNVDEGKKWPTITFKGTKENLEKLVKAYDPTGTDKVEFKQV